MCLAQFRDARERHGSVSIEGLRSGRHVFILVFPPITNRPRRDVDSKGKFSAAAPTARARLCPEKRSRRLGGGWLELCGFLGRVGAVLAVRQRFSLSQRALISLECTRDLY